MVKGGRSTGACAVAALSLGLNSPQFDTYTCLLSGDTVTPYGNWPVSTRPTTDADAVSITESELAPNPATETWRPSGDTVRPHGNAPALSSIEPLRTSVPSRTSNTPTRDASPSLT